MENVKETIAKNLANLRKAHGMTQGALAEKLNYSDKAISRWEHAETLPDIETLCRICDIYGVRFEYLLSKDSAEAEYRNPSKANSIRHIIICLVSICTVWLAATTLFAAVGTLFDKYMWQLFIWAIPTSSAVISVCNKLWWKKRLCSAITASMNNWTLILALYLQFISYNFWLLFIVGIPIQAIILLTVTMPEKRTVQNER